MIVDRSGALVWEESDYDPATGRYLESIWQLGPNGPQRRFGPASAPPVGLGIARDGAGCTYRVDQRGRAGPAIVYRRCPGRPPWRLLGDEAAARGFRPALVNDVAGVAFDSNGRFLFRHGGTVRRIDRAGQVTTIATGLAHENFGIAMDRAGRLLVAEFDNRRVIAIAGEGRTVAAVSPPGWAPTGVAAGPDGRFYVLEASVYRPGQPLRMQVRAIDGSRSTLIARLTVAE